jgi:hypothetical protein
MTAYQPEQWHDMFVAMAGAAATLTGSRSIADGPAGVPVPRPAPHNTGRLSRGVEAPRPAARDGRSVVTSDWFRAGAR